MEAGTTHRNPVQHPESRARLGVLLTWQNQGGGGKGSFKIDTHCHRSWDTKLPGGAGAWLFSSLCLVMPQPLGTGCVSLFVTAVCHEDTPLCRHGHTPTCLPREEAQQGPLKSLLAFKLATAAKDGKALFPGCPPHASALRTSLLC